MFKARARVVGLSAIVASSPAAGSEHPDAAFFRRQADHQARNLSLLQEARENMWHEVARRMRDGERVDHVDDETGTTLVHLAAKAGRRRLVDELLDKKAPLVPDRRGRTPLHLAAAAGHATVVETLLRRGASVDAPNPLSGATALHVTAQAGQHRLTRWLLERARADPGIQDMYGTQPLHKAVAFGHVAAVEALLDDNRVDVNARVGTPRSPPEYEAVSGDLAASHTYHLAHKNHGRIAALLLAAGADPNLRCGEGLTAAHRAALAGNECVLQELRACARTDWGARDPKGRTPAECAPE